MFTSSSITILLIYMEFDQNRTLASCHLSLLWLWDSRLHPLSKHHGTATAKGKMLVLRASSLGLPPKLFARVLPSRTRT